MMQKLCRKDFSCYLKLLTKQTAAGAVVFFDPNVENSIFSTGPADEGRGSIKNYPAHTGNYKNIPTCRKIRAAARTWRHPRSAGLRGLFPSPRRHLPNGRFSRKSVRGGPSAWPGHVLAGQLPADLFQPAHTGPEHGFVEIEARLMVPGRQIGPQEGIGRQPPLPARPASGSWRHRWHPYRPAHGSGAAGKQPRPGHRAAVPGHSGPAAPRRPHRLPPKATAHHIEPPFQPVHGGRARDDVPARRSMSSLTSLLLPRVSQAMKAEAGTVLRLLPPSRRPTQMRLVPWYDAAGRAGPAGPTPRP